MFQVLPICLMVLMATLSCAFGDKSIRVRLPQPKAYLSDPSSIGQACAAGTILAYTVKFFVCNWAVIQ